MRRYRHQLRKRIRENQPGGEDDQSLGQQDQPTRLDQTAIVSAITIILEINQQTRDGTRHPHVNEVQVADQRHINAQRPNCSLLR